jgi:hypothetical protein
MAATETSWEILGEYLDNAGKNAQYAPINWPSQ